MTLRMPNEFTAFRALLALALLPLAGCAELATLREKTALQEQEIARLRQENAEFQKAYYQTNEQRSSEAQALNEQVEILRRELEKATNLKTERERQLEEQLRKQSLETDAVRVQSESQVERYAQDVQSLNEAVARSDQEAIALRNRIVELESTINLDQTRIQELEKQAADSAAGAISMQSAKVEAETNLAETTKELEATQKLLTGANAELEKLRAAQADAATTSASMAGLQTENEKLKADLTALEEKLKSEGAGPNLANDPALIEAARQLKAKLAEVQDGSRIDVQLDRRGLRVIVPSDYAFNRGTVLLADSAKPLLAEIAAVLSAAAPDRRVRVEGHTDDQPMLDLPFADNWGLGAARADRVRQFLMTEGKMNPAILELATRSHFDPIANNSTPEGRAQNRRVELVVTTPTE